MQQKAKIGRLTNLDGLRGLAAIFVLLGHYTGHFNSIYGYKRPPFICMALQYYAVWYFFILSGFVIFMTVERTSSPMEFLKARFFRLYPTYWMAVLVSFALVGVLGLPGREVGFGHMLINLSMFAHFLGVPAVDNAYWSLTVELFFYFVMAGIIAVRWKSKVEWVMLGLLALSLVEFLVRKRHPEFASHVVFDKGSQILFLKYVCLFSAGVFLYRLRLTYNYGTYVPMIILAMGVCALQVTKVAALAAAILVVITWFAVNGRMNWLSSKPLLFLGAISYPLYLVHSHVGYAILIRANAANLPGELCVLIATLVVGTIACGLHYFIEAPSMAYYKSKFRAPKIEALVAQN